VGGGGDSRAAAAAGTVVRSPAAAMGVLKRALSIPPLREPLADSFRLHRGEQIRVRRHRGEAAIRRCRDGSAKEGIKEGCR
jgi:hypothetical protein